MNAEEILELIKQKGEKAALREDNRQEVLLALSDEKRNLLEWYPFEKGKTILECNPDFGTLTKMFIEKGLYVTAIGRNEAANKVIRLRCPNEKFLQIAVDLDSCMENEKYDYIIMSELDSQSLSYVHHMWCSLKVGGSLFLAGDNRLGLRRLCSSSKADIRGITKGELDKLVEKLQARDIMWYYPLPDYKLPKIVYEAAYLEKQKEPDIPVFQYKAYGSVIDEKAAYTRLIEEGQFALMANSYLLILTR